MEDAHRLLDNVKIGLKQELPDAQYKTLENISDIYEVVDGKIYLIVPNSLEKFRIQKFYLEKMNEFLHKLTSENWQFILLTTEEIDNIKKNRAAFSYNDINYDEIAINVRSLRPEYTFENYVVGINNRQAYLFAVQTANESVVFNPLYIFGEVGLGKTHLMMAIGNSLITNNTNIKLVYTTAQQFVEDYFKSKNKNQKSTSVSEFFDNYYRNADVLMVDDIQYLADRQGSQDEFFKIFEYYYEKKKQIVITSDRPANKLNIMDRLKSRFSWGLQVDIGRPDYETRVRILKQKLTFMIENVNQVNDDVLEYIAEVFDQNVRELEGALRRFVSYCVSFNLPFTLENAKISLQAIISSDKVQENVAAGIADNVQNIVSSYFNIPLKEFTGPSRKQEIVYARNIAIYLLRVKYDIALKKIGDFFGNRDHATVAHAIDKIETELKSNPLVKQDVDNIIKKLDK